MKIAVSDRQCIADIALQVCGSLEGAFAIAERNGLSLTDDLAVGQVLNYELADMLNKQVVRRYEADGVTPTAAASDALVLALITMPVEASGVEEVLAAADKAAPVTLTKIFTNQFDIQMA